MVSSSVYAYEFIYTKVLIVLILFFFPKAMSGSELPFTLAVAATGLTLSAPCSLVALGMVGFAGLFGTIVFAVHEDGKTERARIEKRSKSG